VTTLTVPATPGQDAGLRPVPWRRMAWVTWRQHRLTLAGVAALFAVAAVYLLVTGLQMRDAYAAVTACRPAGSSTCQQVAHSFLNAHVHGVLVTAGLIQVIPALIGAFAGAPVLAREFEAGTFRFAWTQGFGRARWTVAKLVPLAVAVTVAAGVFSVLFSWYYQPIFGAGSGDSPPFAPTIFDLRGVALAAWTLAAFAIGALAGVLIRRVIPAMFATLAVWAGLAYLTGAFLRRHYEAPLITTNPTVTTPAWVFSSVWTRGGKPASLSMINQTLGPVGVHSPYPDVFESYRPIPASFDPVHYLTRHGFALLTTYQPVSRYWPFQWIEGGWLLALSLLLGAATVWLVRRRAS
jgi:hypothetical protein